MHKKNLQTKQIYSHNPTHANLTFATHNTNQSIQTTSSNILSKFQESNQKRKKDLKTLQIIQQADS